MQKQGLCKHCGARITLAAGYWRTPPGSAAGSIVCKARGDGRKTHELWPSAEVKKARAYRRREKEARRRALVGQTDDVRFFIENAGYSYDPKTETPVDGMRRNALALAEAEKEAERRGWSVAWEDAPEGCLHDAGCCDASRTMDACLRDADGKVLASLGQICLGPLDGFGTYGKPRGYCRVVEAELACEALHEIREAERADENARRENAL